MHPELERTLCERHPKIFPLHVSDANAVPFHFACDDGWFDLLDVLAGALQAETDNRGAPQLVAKQVKCQTPPNWAPDANRAGRSRQKVWASTPNNLDSGAK